MLTYIGTNLNMENLEELKPRVFRCKFSKHPQSKEAEQMKTHNRTNPEEESLDVHVALPNGEEWRLF